MSMVLMCQFIVERKNTHSLQVMIKFADEYAKITFDMHHIRYIYIFFIHLRIQIININVTIAVVIIIF